ncbi:RHS repeat-associated core domain-containing protein [Candidatus Sumerlaeota bacterium]
MGRIEATVNELGTTTTYQYDDVGNLLFLTDENGRTTEYVYDDVYNLTQVIDADANVTTSTYDGNSRLKTVTDPEGNTTELFYDEAGNLIETKNALGVSTYYEYDLAGRRTKFTDAEGHFETYEYDAVGNRTRLVDRNGYVTQWAYDELGRLATVTDAEENQTHYTYDKVSRIKTETDAEGQSVNYGYDLAGNLSTITPPRGHSITRSYDALNRLESETDQLGRTKYYEYDATSNLTRFTAADGTSITYQYDVAGHRTRSDYPDGTSAVYSYDNAGNLLTVLNVNGTSTYVYDSLDRMASHTDTFGKTVGYEYDGNNQVAAIIYPDTKRVEYTYDQLRRMQTVTDWQANVTTYNYDLRGNLALTTNGNGTKAVYGYDDAQRLTSLSNETSTGSLISSYAYVLDRVGNRIQETRNEPLLPTITPEVTDYSYDGADQILNAGAATFSHDLKGNMASGDLEEPTNYDFDYADRLVGVTRASGSSSYVYDDSGRRIAKTDSGNTTRFSLDVNRSLFSVLSDNDDSDAEQAYYVYGLGLVSLVTPSGDVTTYHYDQTGNTVALSSASEAVTDAYSYDAFGEIRGVMGSHTQSYRYVGQYGVSQEEDGLAFMRARFFDARTGRFISRDPVFTNNLYIYANNNPVYYIDADGEVVGAAAGAMLGGFGGAVKYGVWDLLIKGEDPTWTAFGGNVLGGATAGAITGALIDPSTSLIAVVGISAVAGTVGYGANDAVQEAGSRSGFGSRQNEFLDPARYLAAGIAGGITGGLGIGDIVGDATAPIVGKMGGALIGESAKKLIGAGISDFSLVAFDYSYRNVRPNLTTSLTMLSPEYDQFNRIQYLSLKQEAKSKAKRKAKQLASQRKQIIAEHRRKEAVVQRQIDSLTSGRGWEAMAGRHGLQYNTVDVMGSQMQFLSGFWYTNVSRIISTRVPRPDITPWLSAHAAARRAVAERVALEYGPNGINTPWLPEIYEAYVIDGKFAVYGK